MKCAWTELMRILPQSIRSDVDMPGKQNLQEIRLRVGCRPLLVFQNNNQQLRNKIRTEDISFVINTASRYSPWAASTMADGYITAPGGHRIGICGDAVTQSGSMTGLRNPRSLCIRVARDFPGIAMPLRGQTGSGIIIGPPGSGKTTLLRDLIRIWGTVHKGSVSVVDQRGELFPSGVGFLGEENVDVLTGCDKDTGMNNLLKAMGPSTIAVDEITSECDARAVLNLTNCGVQILATAHGSSLSDLHKRKIYQPLVENRVFAWAAILHPDQTYHAERMTSCS